MSSVPESPKLILIAEDEPEWQDILSSYLIRLFPHSLIQTFRFVNEIVEQTPGKFDIAIVDIGIGARSGTPQMNWGIEIFGTWLLSSGTKRLVMQTGGSNILFTAQKHLQDKFPNQLVEAFEKRYLPDAIK